VILSVNLVAKRRHWRAGEEIDEGEIPPGIRNKYAVTVSGDDGVTEPEPAPSAPPKRQVKARKRAKG
jgi:hypothetical protein